MKTTDPIQSPPSKAGGSAKTILRALISSAAVSYALALIASNDPGPQLEVKRKLVAPCDVGCLIDGGDSLWTVGGNPRGLFCLRKSDGQLLAYQPPTEGSFPFTSSATATGPNLLVTGVLTNQSEPWRLEFRELRSGKLLRVAAAPHDRAAGLAFDGKDLWCTPGSNLLCRLDYRSGEPLAEYRVSGQFDFCALDCAGTRLLALSRSPDLLVVMELSEQDLKVLSTYEVPPRRRAVLADDRSIWLSGIADSTFHELALPLELKGTPYSKCSIGGELPTTLTDPINIFEATENGDLASLRAILARSPHLVNHRVFTGWKATPLFVAILHDQPDAVRVLIEKGADIEATLSDGMTPLFKAALSNGHYQKQILSTLLDTGADVTTRDRDGRTALHYAAMWSAHNGVIEMLLDHGADINARDSYGCNPAKFAGSDEEAVRYLASLGASIDDADEGIWMAGLTPATQPDPCPRLFAILKDRDNRHYHIRVAAAFTLHRLGSPDQASLNTLGSLLAEGPSDIDVVLLRLAASYGPAARQLLPVVQKHLASSSASIRLMAAIAVREVAPAPPIPVASTNAAVVHGRTVHAVSGGPIDPSRPPGKPTPPRAAPHVTIYFLRGTELRSVESDDNGAYRIELPAGAYSVAWSSVDKVCERNFHRPFGGGYVDWDRGTPLLTLKSGEVRELEIAATMIFVD
ncbi:MAG: ankyrin repeat domain-containing protein [Verrucomicrobiales bacterium]|nr:ankyrin repeat domain-containing protein [Verrucomicrobiales bacterium]